MSTGHIRPRGPGAWELKYAAGRDPQTGRRRTCYVTVRGSKADAQRKLRELLTAVDRGAHVDQTKLTVGAYVTDRIATWPGSARTKEHYGQLAALIAAHLGGVPIQALTTLQVERWHAALRDKGLSAIVVKQAHTLLARTLGDGVRHNLVVRNVAKEQPAPKVERREVEILAADQVGPMLAKLASEPLYPAVIVALYTGVRRGELLALTWADVDLDGKVLRMRRALEETAAYGIRIKEPKTSAGRRDISLPDVVVRVLHDHRRQQREARLALGLGRPPDDALVFPGCDGGHQSPQVFSRRWGRTVARLGLPDVTWHALRHTHASMLIAAGVDVVTVSRRLGHADPRITLSVYSHLFAKDDRVAAAAINRALGG
jgi:integrase